MKDLRTAVARNLLLAVGASHLVDNDRIHSGVLYSQLRNCPAIHLQAQVGTLLFSIDVPRCRILHLSVGRAPRADISSHKAHGKPAKRRGKVHTV